MDILEIREEIMRREAEYAALCEFNGFDSVASEKYLAETERLKTELKEIEDKNG